MDPKIVYELINIADDDEEVVQEVVQVDDVEIELIDITKDEEPEMDDSIEMVIDGSPLLNCGAGVNLQESSTDDRWVDNRDEPMLTFPWEEEDSMELDGPLLLTRGVDVNWGLPSLNKGADINSSPQPAVESSNNIDFNLDGYTEGDFRYTEDETLGDLVDSDASKSFVGASTIFPECHPRPSTSTTRPVAVIQPIIHDCAVDSEEEDEEEDQWDSTSDVSTVVNVPTLPPPPTQPTISQVPTDILAMVLEYTQDHPEAFLTNLSIAHHIQSISNLYYEYRMQRLSEDQFIDMAFH